MRKPILAALLLPLAAHAADDISAKVITPFELNYRADPQIPGVGIAVVAGDPQAAAPYTLRVRFAAGASAAPHAHPDERIVTVLEGEYRFADGTKFDGPQELKRALLQRKDDFLRHLTTKLLGFALGRGLTIEDQCAVEEIVKNIG